jgi:CheY-like chemotaxis protein
LNQIKKAADRATALTSMLLAFSRKQVLQSHVVDLKSLIQNSLKLLRRVIGSDIELITDLAEDLGYVKVDATQIDQVIMNLAVNSRDAMPLGGKLTIRASNEILDNRHEPVHAECGNREYVMMAITDSGIGMDEETKCHIFEPFFTTKEMGKGSGLGLAAVYGIISQSGGIITVDSAPNQGTTFKIYLPRAEKKEETEGPSEEAAAEGCETILLVEDDDEVRKLASMYLRTKGYSVLEAANSPIALRIAKEYGSPIHMLITDMLMPGGMNGVELIKSIKRLHPAIGTLIITGYIGEFTENTKLIPEQSVLHKPFNGDDLINKVVKILQAKKSGGLHSVLADKPN